MIYTKNLSKLTDRDRETAGPKAVALGVMQRKGVRVPDGFVILASAFDEYCEATGVRKKIKEILGKLDFRDLKTLEERSAYTRNLIVSQEMPDKISKNVRASFEVLNAPFTAVRSSAINEDMEQAAAAGQMESFLGVGLSDLEAHIKKVWASAFLPRALSYFKNIGVAPKDIRIAVIVQRLVESEAAGMAFSESPDRS